MAPEAVPVADVREWRWRHGAFVPKRADHREALPRPQCRSRRFWHRPTRIAGAQGRDEGLIADRPNLIRRRFVAPYDAVVLGVLIFGNRTTRPDPDLSAVSVSQPSAQAPGRTHSTARALLPF